MEKEHKYFLNVVFIGKSYSEKCPKCKASLHHGDTLFSNGKAIYCSSYCLNN